MYYNRFNDEISLSALGLGTMRLPTNTAPSDIDRSKAAEIIEYAYEHGVNYFDTAYRYHDGEAEKFAGEILSRYPRESYYLASKMPGHQMKYENGKLGFSGYLSRLEVKSIPELFEEQLEKCRTPYFDFYLLHNVNESSIDFYTNEELGVVRYLMEQKEKGRIRHLGFSSHGKPETIRRMLDTYGCFEFVQIQLNYLDWTLQDAKTKYELLSSRGIPVVVMESARGGALTRLPETAQNILREMRPGMSIASWAFRFLQSLPGVMVALSGMSDMNALRDNLQTFDERDPLSEEEMKVLLEKVVPSMADIIPCTACRYCCDVCTQELSIPDLISLYSEASFAGTKGGTVGMSLRNIPEDKLPTACVGCGECKKVCPQGIDIPSIMEKFSVMLG
ncbi:MAG: aldo/keto reductase [Eubacteriaceae bacterium]|nr:aldo/keto reductase [Eubacteriaceae bacterium]